MATSTSEFKNLVSNYKTITAASRAANNADPAIRGQLTGLQAQLAPYVAEGYSAGGYDDADTINKDITSYINLIDKNIANGVTKDNVADPVAAQPKVDRVTKEVVASDDKKPEQTATVAGTSNSNLDEITVTAPRDKKINSGPNKRTWNPLGDFSSYTYRISLYAFPPEALTTFSNTGRFDNKDLFLIAQSAGANNNDTKTDDMGNSVRLDAARGEGFDLDLYIDDLEILTLVSAKETGIATNSVNFKFKIIEPYGMTFPTKLVDQQIAIQKLANIKRPVKTQLHALRSHFLLSIRFYGYDENGKIVTSSMFGGDITSGENVAPLDLDSTFERNFPIIISEFKFRIDGKSTIYDIVGKTVNEQVALGAKRGITSDSITAKGSTVGELIGGLGGNTGILDLMNKAQKSKLDPKVATQEIADIYRVVYENKDIQDSSVIDDQDLNKSRVALGDLKTPGITKPTSGPIKKNRTMHFNAGVPLTQVIDQIITQSNYINNALTYTDDEKVQPAQEGDPTTELNAKSKTLQWYIVTPVVEVLGWDNIRNDYAYKTTFVIKSYDVPYVIAPNIKYIPRYPGPHKIYNYWYTGKNSEVLSYEQNYNLLYFNAVSSAGKKSGINMNDTAPLFQKPVQNADTTGKSDGSFESANTVKTFLYSPKDLLSAKVKILGDPDFLMTSTAGTVQEIMKKWYGNGYTINPNSGQIFIEIMFKQVEDYDNTNGLLTPNGNIEFWQYPDNSAMGALTKGIVYQVYRVTSKFSRGMFTQEFLLGLPNFNQLGTSADNQGVLRKDLPKPTDSTRSGTGSGSANTPTDKKSQAQSTDPAATTNTLTKNGGSPGREVTGKLQKIKQDAKTVAPVDDDQKIPKSKEVSSAGRVDTRNNLLR